MATWGGGVGRGHYLDPAFALQHPVDRDDELQDLVLLQDELAGVFLGEAGIGVAGGEALAHHPGDLGQAVGHGPARDVLAHQLVFPLPEKGVAPGEVVPDLEVPQVLRRQGFPSLVVQLVENVAVGGVGHQHAVLVQAEEVAEEEADVLGSVGRHRLQGEVEFRVEAAPGETLQLTVTTAGSVFGKGLELLHVLEELEEEGGGKVEGDVDVGIGKEHRRHGVVVAQGVQPDPGGGEAVLDHVFVRGLVLVPEEDQVALAVVAGGGLGGGGKESRSAAGQQRQ